jgi:hypothetical protein
MDKIESYADLKSEYYRGECSDSFDSGIITFWGTTINYNDLTEVVQWVINTIHREIDNEGNITYNVRKVRKKTPPTIRFEKVDYKYIVHSLEDVKCNYIDKDGNASEKSLWYIVCPLLVYARIDKKK